MTEKKRRPYDPNPTTPLDHWSKNIDPFVMSGQHWEEEANAPLSVGLDVEDGEKKAPPSASFDLGDQDQGLLVGDVGWEREENKDLLQGIKPMSGIFMHPTHDVSYDHSSAKDKGEKL